MKAMITITKFMLVMVLLLVGCTAAATPVPTPTPEPEAVAVKLPWQPDVQFLGFYMAQERGLYADEGLAVTFEHLIDMDEALTIPDRVADGTFDFSLNSQFLVDGQTRTLPLTAIVSILQFSPATFFARADAGIITPADFAGRRVVVKGEGWQTLLELLLASADLTLDDVETISGGFDMTPFYEGEVDIWAGFLSNEVIRARQQGIEVVTFPLHEYNIENLGMPLFTRQEFVENRRSIVVGFTHATLQGWTWAIENPTEAVDIMLELYPELAAERDFHLASFRAYIPLVRPPGVQVGNMDCQRWLRNAAFADLEATDSLCTTDIFERAVQAD